MNRIGSRNNLIKEVMRTLGEVITPKRIDEALNLLSDLQKYEFTSNVPVYFYYDEIIDDVISLTENKNEVDWDAEYIMEIQFSNDEKSHGFWARLSICND